MAIDNQTGQGEIPDQSPNRSWHLRMGILAAAFVIVALILVPKDFGSKSKPAYLPTENAEAIANAWIRDQVQEIGLVRTKLLKTEATDRWVKLTMNVWLQNGLKMKTRVTLVDGLHVKGWRATR